MTHPHRPALLTAAMDAAERGWPVFPLRPGDKRPAGHAEARCPGTGRCAAGHRKPEERATLDTALIRAAWTAADYNVGIATGPAGLVVVDLDLPKPGDEVPQEWADLGCRDGLDVFAAVCEQAGRTMPTETYTVRTRSGGQQLYFTAPAGTTLRSSSGRLGWKIDTRAWGGYVVAAGSTVGGSSYAVVHDAAPAPLPAWLDLLVVRPAPAPMPLSTLRARMRNADAYATAALRGELEKVTGAEAAGQSRNRTLYFAAYAMARFVSGGDLTEAEVTGELTSAGLAVGLGAGECGTAIRSGLARGTVGRRAA